MSKPNFEIMSREELKAYVLSHRDDDEAFHALIDRLHAEAQWVQMPPLRSLADMENHPEFLEKIRNDPAANP